MLRFRAGGAGISVSFWFFATVALFLMLGRAPFFSYILLSILIHEAGHLLLLFCYRGRVIEARFTAFGIDIVKQTRPGMPYLGEMLICVAGAAFNLLAALLLYLFTFQSMRIIFLIASNIAVAIFNLLPIGNLDGGSLIRLVGERFGGVAVGYRLSQIASLLTLALLFGCAAFLLLRGSPNLTLLMICFYLAGVVIRTV